MFDKRRELTPLPRNILCPQASPQKPLDRGEDRGRARLHPTSKTTLKPIEQSFEFGVFGDLLALLFQSFLERLHARFGMGVS